MGLGLKFDYRVFAELRALSEREEILINLNIFI